MGRVDDGEMYRVFNVGIGLVLVVPEAQADRVIARATELGDRGYRIGEMAPAEQVGRQVEYV
jgi:phosphoribosylformylglycinamidine cyclo-ligase